MILLKANAALKAVFTKLINTMGRDIKWTEVFMVNNNNLILVGSNSVLIFDFGNKRIVTNLLDLPLKEDSMEQIMSYNLLENTLNMVLYVFGKWERIKGLTVEKDYPQLNRLFGSFLKEIEVEPVLAEDNLQFYKEGRQITYEDVIQDILDKQKAQQQEESKVTDGALPDENPEDKEKYLIGLWHKMVWTSRDYTFKKEVISASDRERLHIAKNFRIVPYHCPGCSEKLSMVVYPEGKELLIETDQKGVYLARAYACGFCHQFFAPKPQTLLVEGKVFTLPFEDDARAFEDYLDLLGEKGESTSNSHFNEFESDYNNRNKKTSESLDEICEDLDSMSDKAIDELKDKMDSGYYPQKSIEKYSKKVDNKQKSRAKSHNSSNADDPQKENERTLENERTQRNESIQGKTGAPGKDLHRDQRDGDQRDGEQRNNKQRDNVRRDNVQRGKEQRSTEQRTGDTPKNIWGKNTVKETKLENWSTEVREYSSTTLKQANHESMIEDEASTVKNKENNRKIESKQLQKVEDCKGKSYAHILRTLEEIKKTDDIAQIRQQSLDTLMELLERQGKKELNSILAQIPENVSKKQYQMYVHVIEQYREVDTDVYRKSLDNKRDEAEKQEITAYIKRSNTKNRNSHMELYHKLKEEEFAERNVTPFLESIYDKIYQMDDRTIKRICPDLAELTFDEGVQAYEKISLEELLPELKTDVLKTIDQRLTKIKMNESEQLVNKLSKDMRKVITEGSRIHFYDARKARRNNTEDPETLIINKALTTYATGRGRYEFPIMICDSSSKENGAKGFVLTPDHIFYNTMFEAGVIDVMKIDGVIDRKRLLGQGIYAEMKDASQIKLSNSLKLNNLKVFTEVLTDFIIYLKEKPESRDISYMAKEKHKIICCYRCGHVYQGSRDCPKCGANFNK